MKVCRLILYPPLLGMHLGSFVLPFALLPPPLFFLSTFLSTAFFFSGFEDDAAMSRISEAPELEGMPADNSRGASSRPLERVTEAPGSGSDEGEGVQDELDGTKVNIGGGGGGGGGASQRSSRRSGRSSARERIEAATAARSGHASSRSSHRSQMASGRSQQRASAESLGADLKNGG